MTKYVELPQMAANEEMVKRLANHLLDAYGEFVSANEVPYLDGFMAAHNFHCAVIFHLEQEVDFPAGHASELRRIAAGTFERRLRTEPLPEAGDA